MTRLSETIAKGTKTRLATAATFYTDMEDIINYITHILHNPTAAEKLELKVFDSIFRRRFAADSFEPIDYEYLRHAYYRIYVQNYVVYYFLIHNVMKIVHVIYKRRDFENILILTKNK